MIALRKFMSVDEFYTWNQTQPGRWELFGGIPVEMQSERLVHSHTKYRAAKALEDTIATAGLSCHMVLDGPAVRIDSQNSFEPDAFVYCGDPLPDDTTVIVNPVIVVEVLSPGNATRDLRDKLLGYFRVPSLHHYLIVDPDERLVLHHARGSGDTVVTRMVKEGDLVLDPPGLTLPVPALFGPLVRPKE
jgi:Uma2 family endonuclease